jgi:hypothetical protein
MASIYTTDLKIQLMATGENAGTWGQITNTNLTIIQQAIAGYDEVNIAGGAQTTALLMTQNQLSTARNIVLKLTGSISGNQIVTVPNDIEKTWIVSNATTGTHTVTFKYASEGTGQTWSTTDKGIKILYGDGSDIKVVDLSTLSGTVAAAQITTSTITTTQLAAGAVLGNNIAASTITASKLAANSVVANNIVASTITQSKLAANSVGPNQLQSTAVTPATYTAATITVDADGRITAASSGSGGAGGFIPTLTVAGPASGTYTATPSANRLAVYLYAGGGGGTGSWSENNSGGSGGGGGYGFYNKPITQPFAQPYSVGGAGAGTPLNAGAGGAGGNTNFTNVGTVNGGGGGNQGSGSNPGSPGSSGNAPGASLVAVNRGFVVGAGEYGTGGGGGYYGGGSGNTGALFVFENTGT